MKPTHVAVLGCGPWGTTLAKMVAENQHSVTLFCHDHDIAETITKRHINLALGESICLPSTIQATTSFIAACEKATIIIIAVASPFFRQTLTTILPLITSKTKILIATKGLEETTQLTIVGVAHDVLPPVIFSKITIISGPNIAKEIALEKPAAMVAASHATSRALVAQQLLMRPYMRVYSSADPIGVAWGGTLKNVIAIAAGILDGLGSGNNAKAGLMLRGIHEISRMAVHLGAQQETLYGLSGLGDLMTTCSSLESRNHQVGERLGKGESLSDILGSIHHTVEGVITAKAVAELAQKHQIDMPICTTVANVLFKNKPIRESILELMQRPPKTEFSKQ